MIILLTEMTTKFMFLFWLVNKKNKLITTITNAKKFTKEMLNEGFVVQGNEVTGLFDKNVKTITNPVTLETVVSTEFKEGNKNNPLSMKI